MENKKKIKKLEIQDAFKYTQSIINTVHCPLIILDENLNITLVNRSFYRTFKVKPEEAKGQFIYDLGNRQWDIPKLRELLEDILPKTTSFDNFEVKHAFPDIGRRIMLLNARRIYIEANRTKLILLTIEDITESKKILDGLHEKIRQLETSLRTAKGKDRTIAALKGLVDDLQRQLLRKKG
ncbi:PAS domain-containing protein [Candidatus Omnitrophota bacterium]